jgi:hypothetical protein
MISICAETTFAHVMVWVLITVLIGVVVSEATWQRAKDTALLHKGKADPDYTYGTCNSVCFTVLKPSD